MPAQRKKPKVPKTETTKYSGWEFCRDFFAGIFGLLNSGRIFPAFGLMLLAIMSLTIWRLPDTELASLVRDFLAVLRSSFGIALSLFMASNAIWFWLFDRQKKIYTSEIERLVEIRSQLLHQGHDLVSIRNHRSSDGEQTEGYILPDLNENTSEEKK